MEINQLQKAQIQALYKDDNLENLIKHDQFNVLLNQNPPAKWIKLNPYAGNSQYLPIDKVEYLLRKIFKKYKVDILRESTMFNSVYVTIRLHYFNPINSEWEYQDGIGAEQIQTKKGSSPADLASINNNAVAIALPKAETAAIKDAAHKIGRIFGSDLNRKEIEEVKPDQTLYDRQFDKEKERIIKLMETGYEPTQDERDRFEL